MSTWAVTLKTSRQQWSTIEVEAADHRAAIASAKRLLGNYPVTDVVRPGFAAAASGESGKP